jgi:hypothetical protein
MSVLYIGTSNNTERVHVKSYILNVHKITTLARHSQVSEFSRSSLSSISPLFVWMLLCRLSSRSSWSFKVADTGGGGGGASAVRASRPAGSPLSLLALQMGCWGLSVSSCSLMLRVAARFFWFFVSVAGLFRDLFGLPEVCHFHELGLHVQPRRGGRAARGGCSV